MTPLPELPDHGLQDHGLQDHGLQDHGLQDQGLGVLTPPTSLTTLGSPWLNAPLPMLMSDSGISVAECSPPCANEQLWDLGG